MKATSPILPCGSRDRAAPLYSKIHRAHILANYFAIGCGSGPGFDCAGLAGFGCAGVVFAGADLVPENTDPLLCERRAAKIERVIEVTMKMMAAQVVALLNTVAAVRVPKAVWLPMPPNAAAMSPLWPLCSNTTMIRKRQTIT